MIAFKKKRPKAGNTYGEYTVIFVGYRGTEEVYICQSSVTGEVYLKTEVELREERVHSRERSKAR